MLIKGQIFETIIGAFILIIAGWFIFSVVSKSENIFPNEDEVKYVWKKYKETIKDKLNNG